jgi:hypothetical protein
VHDLPIEVGFIFIGSCRRVTRSSRGTATGSRASQYIYILGPVCIPSMFNMPPNGALEV